MRNVVAVPVRYLKNSEHNPPARISQKNIRELVLSMEAFGQLCPILIDKNKTIIEGHRRVAAAKVLKMETIDCLEVEGDTCAIYASVNSTSRRMTSNDLMGVYLSNKMAVSPRKRSHFDNIVEEIGLPLFKRMYEHGHSCMLHSSAVYLANYCGVRTPEKIKAILKWLLDGKAVLGDIRKALVSGIPAKSILKSVEENKSFKLKVVAS